LTIFSHQPYISLSIEAIGHEGEPFMIRRHCQMPDFLILISYLKRVIQREQTIDSEWKRPNIDIYPPVA
jgi:hypothetical protein